eukprot:5103346-Pleurochrysis_carterae.AAC.5
MLCSSASGQASATNSSAGVMFCEWRGTLAVRRYFLMPGACASVLGSAALQRCCTVQHSSVAGNIMSGQRNANGRTIARKPDIHGTATKLKH